MPVRTLLQSMTSAEFAEWMAYDSIDPIGDDRGDLQAGVIASTVASVHRKEGSKPFVPRDFMPLADAWKAPEKVARERSAELLAKVKATFGRMIAPAGVALKSKRRAKKKPEAKQAAE